MFNARDWPQVHRPSLVSMNDLSSFEDMHHYDDVHGKR